eukprot:m.145641 g.145641  ORF g.145641 m.145641 type:complete len:816 (-) comp16218_c2_seq1:33-2480(-)
MPANDTMADNEFDLQLEDDDLVYEEAILRDPYSVKQWLRYVERKRKATPAVRFSIYERAAQQLPGSYKIWSRYLFERRRLIKDAPPGSSAREAVYDCYQRALVFMHKMPRIWIDYLELMMTSGLVTRTRQAFDACLRALAITQHHRVWPMYLKFVQSIEVPETACRVYRRYLMVEPNDAEEYVDYLIKIERYDEAARVLVDVLNREKYNSKKGKTHHQLWMDLCDLISKHPAVITSIKVEPIIRGGLRRFSDMIGALWCSLATFYIRGGHFEKARDVYEEAIKTVHTVRDFSQVFEAYAEFEEQTLSTLMESVADGDDNVELELKMARYEHLMERRPLLLSSVLLRQNPHNVDEWHKRVALFEGSPTQMVRTYTDAVKTVDTGRAVGKVYSLWVEFAKLYESNNDLAQARAVFERGVQEPFRKVEDLATLWCQYAEMEIRNKQYKMARQVLQRATAMPSKRSMVPGADGKLAVQARVHKSLQLWSMYADIEESLGTVDTTKAVYNRMLELRVATPQIIINFGLFLEENSYFEEAFTAYERGVSLFKWPVVFEIWNTYLAKFIKRYGGDKLERARELFEQAVTGIPKDKAKIIYLMYANFEEQYGLGRHAMAVYARATHAVAAEDRFEMWQLYIKRAAAIFGVVHTREIYASALEDDLLSDKDLQHMALQFATLETKLGEIDRARAIYSHTSQYCNPKHAKSFWASWNDFEVRHGNEDTYREMLRIKRSVSAQFNTSTNLAVFKAAQEAAKSANAMALAEDAVKEAQPGFVKAGGEAANVKNTDEIALDDDDDDDDDDIVVSKRSTARHVIDDGDD